jgi:hypothetical protein
VPQSFPGIAKLQRDRRCSPAAARFRRLYVVEDPSSHQPQQSHIFKLFINHMMEI